MSAAEKARNDSVRTLPNALRLKFSAVTENSSGASRIVTTSYRPCVQKSSFTVTPKVAAIFLKASARFKMEKIAEQYRHHQNASIAILNVGRMNDGVEQEAYCVDKNVPLRLARIVPVRINARPSPLFRASHALAVDDGGGRTRFPLRSFATLLIERVVDPLQCAVICPQIEVVV